MIAPLKPPISPTIIISEYDSLINIVSESDSVKINLKLGMAELIEFVDIVLSVKDKNLTGSMSLSKMPKPLSLSVNLFMPKINVSVDFING